MKKPLQKIKIPTMGLWSILIAASVLIDQISKLIVVKTLPLHDSVVLIKGFFSFTHIQNRGAAWGMFSENRWVFLVATAIAIIILPIVLYKYRNIHALFGISMSMIIGGAIGNMIDRVFLGYVVDFLEFTFIDFPVFNIADVCIVIGTFMMAAYILFFDKVLFVDNKKTSETAKEEKDTQTDVGTHNKNL
jgi:signal peptidase II